MIKGPTAALTLLLLGAILAHPTAKGAMTNGYWRAVFGILGQVSLLLLGIGAAASGVAQVSQPTQKDLETAPVQFRAEVTGNPAFANIEQRTAPPGARPTTGAHDFTGAYSSTGDGGGGPAAGAPDAAAARGGASGEAGETANRGCIPDFVTGIGAGYPTHVVTGRDVMVIVHEENHKVRRIYLNGEHPKNLQPSINGHSTGRFEGDTLVIETVGLKSGQTVVERIRKVDGGRQVETTVNGRATLANWRPDLGWVENICEDAGDLFGPQYRTRDWKK